MLRFRTLLVTIICLALSFVPGARGEDYSDQYVITLQVIVTDQKFTMDCQRIDTGEDSDDLISVGDIYAMTVGDIVLDLESDLIWNGQATPPENSGIELLTAPQLVVPAGESAELRTGATVQYFEKQNEDCYVVRTLPLDSSPGIFMEIMPTAGPDGEDGVETVHLDFKVRIVTIGERAPVPGVNLDVGQPNGIHMKGIESTYTYSLDRWNVISSHLARDDAEKNGEKLLILVRVKRPPAG